MAIDLTRDFTAEEPEERDFSVFPKGEYPFSILEINEFAVSKAGNDKLPLKLQFKDEAGNTSNVFEDLVFTEKALFKINQFLASVGVPKGTRINWRDDEFRKYLKIKTGRAILGIETYTDKSNKEREKNVVERFVYDGTSKRDDAPPAHKAAADPAPEMEDNDIPF